jgi:hypothetical protein
MDQKIAQKLMNSEEGVALAKFLDRTIDELDSVIGISLTGPMEIAIEVKARQRAAEKLRTILSTLLTPAKVIQSEGQNSEYAA